MNGSELKTYVEGLLAGCATHEDWLTVVRFGLGALLEHPALFFGLVIKEAARMVEREESYLGDAGTIQIILDELGVRLTVA